MERTILKYLQLPSNEGKIIGLFVLTKRYEFIMKRNKGKTLLSFSSEFIQYYKAIGPTFFCNYIELLETQNENEPTSEMLITLLQLFIHSDEVINHSMSYPITLSLVSRIFNEPSLQQSLPTVLVILGALFHNPQIKKSKKIKEILPNIYSKLVLCEAIHWFSQIITIPEYCTKFAQCISKTPQIVVVKLIPWIKVSSINLTTKQWLLSFCCKLLSNKLSENDTIQITSVVSQCIDSSKDILSIRPLESIKILISRLSIEVRSNLSLNSKRLYETSQIVESLIIILNDFIRFNEGDEIENNIIIHSRVEIDQLANIYYPMLPVLYDLQTDVISWLQECILEESTINDIILNESKRQFLVHLFQLVLTGAVLVLDIKKKNEFELILPLLEVFKKKDDDFKMLWNAWETFNDVIIENN
ncbi:hypothetical protein CL6EHI_197420 [Entamoeba histolytica]|uniref:Uncharacterized protein n=1 Tax=Entamoeba histolytica TaxID=5759 RepID=A0A175JGP4_ENTHI|nr:hypothetical protein CL6EHI_197420 [Entamoeba histolytica]